MIDLIIKNTSNKIFQMTVDLGIALLEGGNSIIQVCRSTTSSLVPAEICPDITRMVAWA